jgi:type IV pilus assembly protein PilN
MMIRINLLPVRQVKKRELGRQFIVAGVGIIIAAMAGNYVWYVNRESERARRQSQADDTQHRIAELEKVIGEVNNINKRKKEVQDKLAVLEKLRKQRAGPVRILDALSTCIPKKVVLDRFMENNSAVNISGRGESLDDVSEFVRGLRDIVWTPKGIGRMVEHKRDAPTARVELLTGDGSMQDFQMAELSNFFSKVELISTQSTVKPTRLVTFELTLNANYAI